MSSCCRRECWWVTSTRVYNMMTWCSTREETDAVGHQHSRLQHVMTWLSQQGRKLMLWVTSTRVYNMMTSWLLMLFTSTASQHDDMWQPWGNWVLVSPALASTDCHHGRKLMLWVTSTRLQHDDMSWHGRKLMLWVTSTRVYNMMTWLLWHGRKRVLVTHSISFLPCHNSHDIML